MDPSAPDPEILKMIEIRRKEAQELRKRRMEEKLLNLNGSKNCKTDPTNQSSQITKNQIHSSAKSQISTKNSFTTIRTHPNITSQNIPPRLTNSMHSQVPYSSESKHYDVKQKTVASDVPLKKIIKISLELQSSKRFQMKFDYETKIINVLKNFSSKQWDPISKKWSLSIEDYTEIINRLKIIKAIADNAARSKKIDLSEKFDSEFIKTLYPYQREGIIFGIQREGRCLIADDMGLGKTIQAIGLAIWYRDDWPLIIVCPSSLRFQWANFILKWAPNINEEDIFVATNTKNLLPKVLITIISYDLMARTRSRFSVETNRYYNMIIMDESHYVKSDVAHRTSVASLIAQTCKRVVLLSGTPALSRPIGEFDMIDD
ncbi:hypothetical protein NH340_JMT06352 [Sarcoptes scabiei]|nr:hypothetical protein NH340_JMT06352 [Sarcoptes scabiei]